MRPTELPPDLEVGFDIPALPGMPETEIQTPCLIVDLDAFERNLRKLGHFAAENKLGLRVHCKMHKSVDVARLQHDIGGATGICCQKVSEAEVFARAGFKDILLTNQIRDPAKLARLARLPRFGARVGVCLDDARNVAEIARAAQAAGTRIDALVELDCGAGRCGVTTTEAAVEIAKAIAAAPELHFRGLQAYHGSAQHYIPHTQRVEAIARAEVFVREVIAALSAQGIECELVTGAGSGSFEIEGRSGVWNELQCGSYAFMDASYGAVLDASGKRLDQGTWENALFLLTSVMSTAKPNQAVCDAGLKVQSVDSGLPFVFGRPELRYTKCSDEHGQIDDPEGRLHINDKLRLVPGHCDPTCNIHDWYVAVRGGVVEAVWPVSARGKAY